MKSQMLFRELREYSDYTFERKLKDFYEHITQNIYMEPYFSKLKEGFSDFNEKYQEEMGKGAVFLPDDEDDRLPSVLGMMNEVARNGGVIAVLRYRYGGRSLREAFSKWYDDIATYVMDDIFSDIAFDIEAIENKQENKNKDDENINIPQNIITYHGGNHNTQIGNNNVQNIITDEVIGELKQSDMYKDEDNRSVVLENIKDMRDELDKEEPSEERVKGFMKKVIDTGEDKVIQWAFEHFGKIPAFISVVPELFK